MPRNRLFLLVITVSLLLSAGCGERAEDSADLIVINARVYTVDNDFSVVESLAVKDGRILATGTSEEMLEFKNDSTTVVDATGQTVIPGLIDAHAHLLGYAATLDQLNVVDTASSDEILQLVAAKAAELDEGDWITGRGWDQNDWPVKEFPTAEMLDEVSPGNPVFLRRIDGHAGWANTKALELAGVTQETEAPGGGEIIRDSDGNPTGVFIDTAMGLISSHIPGTPPERLKELLAEAVRHMHGVGITGNHEMGGGQGTLDIIRELIDEGKFDYRMAIYISSGLENLAEMLSAEEDVFGEHQLVIAGLKAYADGALGSRGAALLEPYSDRPETSGLIITDEDGLAEFATLAMETNKQIVTHAIGDRANHIVLNAYERALKSGANEDRRFRIEHAQIIAPDDMPRFAELGVLPSMQPTHCTSDFPWALDRIGEQRAVGAYAWRTLLDDGNYIPCGSDFPVEHTNPFFGFYSAITRQHQDGTPENGYFPDQVMTREEALRGFTLWAAQAAFMEDVLGSLEKGKYADFIIIDRDIVTASPVEIPLTSVLKTYVGGELVYEKAE